MNSMNKQSIKIYKCPYCDKLLAKEKKQGGPGTLVGLNSTHLICKEHGDLGTISNLKIVKKYAGLSKIQKQESIYNAGKY
jgi:hypothetical protein